MNIRLKEKFTGKWYSATSISQINMQFGGWHLAKTKRNTFLVKENYTHGAPNYGVILGDDFDRVEKWFDTENTNMLHNYFETAYTLFAI